MTHHLDFTTEGSNCISMDDREADRGPHENAPNLN